MSDLLAEARRLARPSVLLKPAGAGDPLAAIWGGPGIVAPPGRESLHWLSVDCRYFPEGLGPGGGVLSLYTNEERFDLAVVRHDPGARLTDHEGERLTAAPALSLPPPDAFSAENDDAYIRHWQANCPLYTDEAVAVLGGWHFPWPDGDWHELQDRPLLLWTIRDAEPWGEVWDGPHGYEVMERIT